MKKKLIIIGTIIIVTILIFINFKDKRIVNKDLYLEHSNNYYEVVNKNKISILEDSYQEDIDRLIFNQKNNKLYTAKSPLLILNPYGTNITGMYIYFYTFLKYKIEYTISVDDKTIPDFTNTLSGGMKRKHEGHIIGLIQGMENKITLKLIDKDNNIKYTYQYKINIPDFNTNSIKIINSNILTEESKISDGLYMIVNIDNSGNNDSMPLSFYDRYGVLRSEFTKKSGNHTNRVIFINNNFFYAITNYDYALINNLGKIIKNYHTDYKNNHDYTYFKKDNSIIYINGTHVIRKLDLKSGKDSLILDLSYLMPNYVDKAVTYYQQNYEEKERSLVDWAHVNSIEIIDDKDCILSLRETSSIIYLTDFFTNPTIKYIIAPERIYEGTEYANLLLKQVGDFNIHAGQHSVIMENDSKLENGQYYLYFFNNNYTNTKTVFNDDWIDTIPGTGKRNLNVENSMYYKYLVNEKEKTFTLVDSFNVPYSNAKSNIQKFGDHYISVSGKRGVILEYDTNKKLLLELRIDVYNDIYRAYKCDMKNFWFDDTYQYTERSYQNNKTVEENEDNISDFYYNKKTNTILGINTESGNSKESNIIYYDNIYFTMYDYTSDTLVIPSTINGTSIKKITGINYSNVKKVVIEEGIEEIGDYAFLGMDNLEEITLPSTLKKIGKYAFVKCTSIHEIHIPKSVTYIGQNAFEGWNENQTVEIVQKGQGYSKTWKRNSKAKFNIEVKE